MIRPMTDAQNYTGKAYTIREGESLAEWFRRGSGESGEAREKFKATIYHLVRKALRESAGQYVGPLEPPPPESLSRAYGEIQAWAAGISRDAGLDDWSAELLDDAIQRAYEMVSWGPDVAELHAHRMTTLLDLDVTSSPAAFERFQSRVQEDPAFRQVVADASAQADQWVLDAIREAKLASGNPHDDDVEAIARAILAKLRAE